MFDDKEHDTLFVQHCLLLHHEYLTGLGKTFARHWVWSDRAASQFKARQPFYFIGRYVCSFICVLTIICSLVNGAI